MNCAARFLGVVIRSLDLYNSFSRIAIPALCLNNQLVPSDCNSFHRFTKLVLKDCNSFLRNRFLGSNCVNRKQKFQLKGTICVNRGKLQSHGTSLVNRGNALQSERMYVKCKWKVALLIRENELSKSRERITNP